MKVCLSNTYSIFRIRDSHKSTVMIGCVRVSGKILRREDVEINEPRLFKICIKVLNRNGLQSQNESAERTLYQSTEIGVRVGVLS